MNITNKNGQSLLDVIDNSLGIEKEQIGKALKEINKIRESISELKSADMELIKKTEMELLASKERLEIFRLFGTSGIRGILKNIYSSVVEEYEENTFMSPKLAYYYGRAYGWMISELDLRAEIRLNMDPRPSSITMATTLSEGLIEEGIDIYFNGVASTPMGALYDNSIIITASHNDIRYNGIKAFIHGIPITFEMEEIIEKGFRLLGKLETDGWTVAVNKSRGKVTNSAAEAGGKYLELGRKTIVREKLCEYKEDKIVNKKLKNTVMPLDLAFGAAGANVLNKKKHKNLSPQLTLLLETGMVIIGYGAERDGERTNYKIGAAYPYGETPDIIGRGELESFAKGEYGYGDDKKGGHISRSFYFPGDYVFKEQSLIKDAMKVDNAFVFLDADNPSKKNILLKLLEEIKGYELLPACSVDCDEDRFLAASPFLSNKPVPYLSGDLMIMLFAANLQDSIKKVVFTVESGLSIGKYLKRINVDYQEVTVGDRAIADYIMDRERLKNETSEDAHKIIGGEPSGHMMFGAMEKGKMTLIDDPIITQLKILGLMRKTQKSFDILLKEIFDEVEEVYTARKPEAWAGKPNCRGISLSEKINLEFRKRGAKKVCLSDYAKKFIPAYIDIFGDGYIKACYENVDYNLKNYPKTGKSVYIFPEYEELLTEGKVLTNPIEYFHLGNLNLLSLDNSIIEDIRIMLRLSNKSWGGPSDINLSFYAPTRDSEYCLIGGVASRNSGTSPKNSAYNKLWHFHYLTETKIDNKIIEKVTTEMAERRVEFTNNYIKNIRKPYKAAL